MTIQTPQDFNLFYRMFLEALCLWREARGESRDGKIGVLSVIRNRAADPRWPDNTSDVILQRKQFSSFNLGEPNSILFPKETDPSWLECVEVVMSDPPDVTDGAVYYFADYIPAPWWSKNLTITVKIGRHVFLK